MVKGKPFSSKQKREQLRRRRERKQNKNQDSSDENENDDEKTIPVKRTPLEIQKINECKKIGKNCKVISKNYNPNRYRLHFFAESKEDMKMKRLAANEKIQMKSISDLIIEPSQYFIKEEEKTFPKRPSWSDDWSKTKLDEVEEKYLNDFVQSLIDDDEQLKKLGYFELNLETWRQFWRVVEMSDIILMVTDMRFSMFQMNDSIYNYLVNEKKKELFLVLNKIDLLPTPLVIGWYDYFQKRYPKIKIIFFSSFPIEIMTNEKLSKRQLTNLRFHSRRYSLGPLEFVKCLESYVERRQEAGFMDVDIDEKWKNSMKDRYRKNQMNLTEINLRGKEEDNLNEFHELINSNLLTIGCIGFPNVGKSTVINCLKGKKVVSVSRTPGHTKYFQTIHLTKTIRLCDCPGLVFPSLCPKTLQILSGVYPVAQVREPLSVVQYLSEHLTDEKKNMRIINLLKLNHSSVKEIMEDLDFEEWSASAICQTYASIKKYFCGKGQVPNVHKAANEIIKLSLEGRKNLRLVFYPPNYFDGNWETDRRTLELEKCLKRNAAAICEYSNLSDIPFHQDNIDLLINNSDGEISEDESSIEDDTDNEIEKELDDTNEINEKFQNITTTTIITIDE
ncbi:hypothetical protein SNEBB_003614 [Seison nebaliae]|nr:hypothetical protein SNEBB_003614 [Seison nebaliae]